MSIKPYFETCLKIEMRLLTINLIYVQYSMPNFCSYREIDKEMWTSSKWSEQSGQIPSPKKPLRGRLHQVSIL